MNVSIEALEDAHDADRFTCGVEALDDWLKQIARQHVRKGISRTFVAVDPNEPEVLLGFYSLTVGEAHRGDLPEQLAKKLPQKIPIVLIGRLATALSTRGQGVGKDLLIDALSRIIRISEEIGIAAILVDAKDDNAAQFYQHFGFLRLTDDSKRLVLPVATAKTALA
jgi:GNAT superfamily N-acetyltransferase